MKRFTTFLMATLFAFASLAQNVEVEELWNDSRRSNGTFNPVTEEWEDGDAPDWMGSYTERGMTQFDGKIYIPSTNEGKKILVLDALTGSLTNTINLPEEVAGGARVINSIGVTESGDLILANLAGNTKSEDPAANFKVYRVVLNAPGTDYESVTEIINWGNLSEEGDPYPTFRVGDQISFYGDISTGANGYLLAAVAGTPYVLRFDVTAGVVASEPVTITLANSVPAPAEGADVNLGISPYTSPISDTHFIADGKDLRPSIYDMSGEMVSGMTGETTVKQGGGNGAALFQLEGREFLIANTTIWNMDPKNAFELFEVPGNNFAEATSIGVLPEEGLGYLNSNTTFTYPVAVDVLPNEVLLYLMANGSGIAAYKITIGTGTSVSENVADQVGFFPNPASDVVNFTNEMASVKVYDMSGKFVREFKNVIQINVSDLRGTYVIHATDRLGNAIKKVLIVK